MNKHISTLFFTLVFGLVFGAETNVVLTTQFEDGSTNKWTQSDLTDALGLMNRKYHRDMATESGRRAWHGNRLQQFISTNELGRLVRVDVYADGYVNVVTGRPRKVTSPDTAAREAAARDAAAREARQAEALAILQAKERATLPPAVAALLQKRREAATTNEVSVTVSP